MQTAVLSSLVIALVSALAAILLGRNWTRSMAASGVAVAGLAVAMLSAGTGLIALFVATVAALVLATIQLFGWMLVDVDRDHLPSTDRMTWLARVLAFLLVGGGLVLLVWGALREGFSSSATAAMLATEPIELGVYFFGADHDLATLCGLALAAGLLATLMLLREEGENR